MPSQSQANPMGFNDTVQQPPRAGMVAGVSFPVALPAIPKMQLRKHRGAESQVVQPSVSARSRHFLLFLFIYINMLKVRTKAPIAAVLLMWFRLEVASLGFGM